MQLRCCPGMPRCVEEELADSSPAVLPTYSEHLLPCKTQKRHPKENTQNCEQPEEAQQTDLRVKMLPTSEGSSQSS